MLLALVVLSMTGGTAMADLQEDVQRCWNPPAGATGASVSVRLNVGADGQLTGIPTSPHAATGNTAERAAAEAGIRAVRRCAPYRIPAGDYEVAFGANGGPDEANDAHLASCVREHIGVEAEIDRPRGVLRMTISNRLSYAISSLSYEVVVTEPGRSVPWHTSESGLAIAGGIEPGETRTIGAHMSRISSDAGNNLDVAVTVLDAADQDKTSIAGVSRFRDWSNGPSERGCP